MKLFVPTSLCLAAALFVSVAHAQTMSNGPSTSLDTTAADTTRGTPNFVQNQTQTGPIEPQTGIHVGGFMLYPTLEGDVNYNDNIYAAQTNAVSDEIYKLKPGLSLISNWSVHQLDVWANLDQEWYDQHSNQDQTNYSFGAKGMLEATYSTHIYGSSEYDHLTEEFGNTNLPGNALQPTKYTDWASELGVAQRLNRFTFHLGGTYSELRFDNTPELGGGVLPESLRSRNVSTEYFDGSYEFSEGYSSFLRGTINQREYLNASFGPRNSNGYEIDAGVRAEVTRLITGEAYVGYLNQSYKGFSGVGGPSFGILGVWAVTPITTISANIARTLEETDEFGSSGYFSSGGTLTVLHELTRTIKVHVGVLFDRNDYQNIDRHENVYGPTVGADYSLTPRLNFGLSYEYTRRDSTINGADYSQNQVTAALKLAL